jgi:hypothetical protein
MHSLMTLGEPGGLRSTPCGGGNRSAKVAIEVAAPFTLALDGGATVLS